eukprot:2556581-Rhodomonas_salina.2
MTSGCRKEARACCAGTRRSNFRGLRPPKNSATVRNRSRIAGVRSKPPEICTRFHDLGPLFGHILDSIQDFCQIYPLENRGQHAGDHWVPARKLVRNVSQTVASRPKV